MAEHKPTCSTPAPTMYKAKSVSSFIYIDSRWRVFVYFVQHTTGHVQASEVESQDDGQSEEQTAGGHWIYIVDEVILQGKKH